jgi:hypothetical protein
MRAWVVALLLQGILLGGTALALWTGGQEEERFEERAGEVSLDAHQRAAQAFGAAVTATFAVGTIGFLLRRRRRPFVAMGAGAVALSLAALALGIQVGHQGGLMVHARVGQTGSAGAEAADPVSEEEEDD